MYSSLHFLFRIRFSSLRFSYIGKKKSLICQNTDPLGSCNRRHSISIQGDYEVLGFLISLGEIFPEYIYSFSQTFLSTSNTKVWFYHCSLVSVKCCFSVFCIKLINLLTYITTTSICISLDDIVMLIYFTVKRTSHHLTVEKEIKNKIVMS
jgi:hypothetical protein